MVSLPPTQPAIRPADCPGSCDGGRRARPSSGQPSSGQPSSGQPSSGQPSSGRPSSGRPSWGRPSWGRWTRLAARAGLAAAGLSRRLEIGEGSIIGGRVTLALHPHALSRLAAGRRVVLVSGTNGKTTTSHLLAAALHTAGSVAHNTSGSNMVDGAVAALAAAPDAPYAVLEVDELHLARVAAAVDPAVVVLLNLTRDQLDRGAEVRAVAAALHTALDAHPDTTVVANADDPMVVEAASAAAHTVWVAAGGTWAGDTGTCPRCGRTLHRGRSCAISRPAEHWACGCGLARPRPAWAAGEEAATTPHGVVPLRLRLPGRFNLGNAVMAMAAATLLGIEPHRAAAAMADLDSVVGRYAIVQHGDHEVRLLLAKNPAGWAETLHLLDQARSLLVAVNAREPDGRDTSWLWDVAFEQLSPRPVVAAGERAADVGVRLSYAEIGHDTVPDPLAGLALLPPGKVDVVANYTAFAQLHHRLGAEAGT